MVCPIISLIVAATGYSVALTLTCPAQPAAPVHELLLEAEEFEVVKGPWRVISLGENYCAATLSNTFISRQKLRSVSEECDEAVATHYG
jgi:hypothetical protein